MNRKVDRLGERLHNRTSQLEELSGRLKEFEEGRQAVERRLEAAKHQIEVQEALGPQVLNNIVDNVTFLFHCSWKLVKQSTDSEKITLVVTINTYYVVV